MANNGVVLPEVIIHRAIKSVLTLVKEDYDESVNKDESLLASFFKTNQQNEAIIFNSMNYYEQAVDLFVHRKIEVNMGYNLEVADIPNIHILLPSESSKPLGIGGDEGYQENEEVTRPNPDDEEITDTFAAPVFSWQFDASYQLLITSPNVFEILLIYNVLKMGFLSIYENLEFLGLRNPKIGGHDLQIQENLVPTHIFHRSFVLSFFYEINAPRHFREKLIRQFSAVGTATGINN